MTCTSHEAYICSLLLDSCTQAKEGLTRDTSNVSSAWETLEV